MLQTARNSEWKFKAYGRRDIDQVPEFSLLDQDQRNAMKAVSAVLPFRVNNYVVQELIDWEAVPNDPMYQLTFPQEGMLEPGDFARVLDLVRSQASEQEITITAREIQERMNPHPAGQMEMNVPSLGGRRLEGTQHKYRETVLFFPSQGQTCHAYCTYCFRWAQFVGIDELKFANREIDSLVRYLKRHREVTDVLFTGGDPMIMKTAVLRRYIEPLLDAELDHVINIRIGTKAPAYWPFRFLSDSDADDLMRLFDQVADRGRQLALMAHYSHPRELAPQPARAALSRILETGATVRCQAPLIRHVNDRGSVWSEMWRQQVELGAIPYYMFVERDTGAKNYFEVPLARAFEIFSEAYRQVSGLGRTVRGPSMSANPGKIVVDGVTEVRGEKVFVLKFLQGRNPEWANRVFFAHFDPEATWWTQLKPAFGERKFFFAEEMVRLQNRGQEMPLAPLNAERWVEVS